MSSEAEFKCLCGKSSSEITIGRIVPCGHTFCEDCLVKSMEKKIVRCPVDKCVIPIASLGLSNLPRDYRTLPVNYFSANQASARIAALGLPERATQAPMCGLCVGSENHLAEYYCKACCLYLCSKALAMHQLIQGSRDHPVLSMDELDDIQKSVASTEVCADHAKPINSYNATVGKFTCIDCTVPEKQVTMTLSDCEKETRKSIEKLLPNLKLCLMTLRTTEKKLREGENEFTTAVKKSSEQNVSLFKELRDAIASTEEKLEKQLEVVVENRRSMVSARVDSLKHLESNIKAALNRAGYKLKSGNDGDDDDDDNSTSTASTSGLTIELIEGKRDTSSETTPKNPDASTMASILTKLEQSETKSIAPSPIQLCEIEKDLTKLISIGTRRDGLARILPTLLPPHATAQTGEILKLIEKLSPSNYVVTKELYRTAQHPLSVFAVTVSPDGKYLVTAGSGTSQMMTVWDAETGTHIAALAGHTNTVLDVEFSPCGEWLASAGADMKVRFWKVGDWNPSNALSVTTPDYVDAIAWSHDSTKISVCVRNKPEVFVYNFPSLDEAFKIKDFKRAAGTSSWSPDGKYLAAASSDGSAKVYNASTGKCLATIPGSSYIRRLCWFSDMSGLVIGSDDRNVKKYELDQDSLTTNELKFTKTKEILLSTDSASFVNGMIMHPYAPLICVGIARTNNVIIINTETWEIQDTIVVTGKSTNFAQHTGKDVAFSQDGLKLYVGTETYGVAFDFIC